MLYYVDHNREIIFSQGWAYPSHRTFPHSQRSHNMRLVPFKGEPGDPVHIGESKRVAAESKAVGRNILEKSIICCCR